MEHLAALCDVLKMSIDEAASGEASPVTDTEAAMLKMMRRMNDTQAQALLSIAATLAKT